MFSGIVEEIGTVAALEQRGKDGALTVRCRIALGGTKLGDSIAVNGVCLTVTDLASDAFTVGLQPVTLRLTNLGDLSTGDPVNLERSLAVGDRIGGHYVQGHIDGTGRLAALWPDGEAVVARIDVPPEIMRYIVQRAFIAVDGVSLTVMEAFADGFSVSLVKHTQEHITLTRRPIGARVNLEIDVIAKYVERLLGQTERQTPDWDVLRRAGYM